MALTARTRGPAPQLSQGVQGTESGSSRARQTAGVPIFLRRIAQPARPIARPGERLTLPVAAPGDMHEREADGAAAGVSAPAAAESDAMRDRAPIAPAVAVSSPVATGTGSTGRPLDADTRSYMEPRLGMDLGLVRVHTGATAERLTARLGAHAFTHGADIFFGSGQLPGRNAITAHELAHVVQQSGGANGGTGGPISARGGPAPIQCTFAATYMIPGSPSVFEIDLQTREGAVNTPPTKSGLDGYIRFVPAAGSPNSNVITMWQVNSTIDASGADVASSAMGAAQAPRGALGTPGLRTEADPLRGVEGGFKTDVLHRPGGPGTDVPADTPLSPRYAWGAAPPGTIGFGGTTQQPASRGGGIGADVAGVTPGFKRSDDPADIRTASLYDFPGTSGPTDVITWTFESAAIGEDTMITYGVVNWGFTVDHGRVINDHLHVDAGTSATFTEALERHRDFYVHEPVTFYFDFNSAALSAAEEAKIGTFTAYLARETDVHLSLEGFADQVGGNSDYNRNLSLRRAEAVEAALLGRGIAANRIDGLIIGHGASTAATTDAGTGDEGGNPAVGADQSREANRQFNRRVVLTFTHVPAAAGP
jgi:outer membrane protein OmpA-like peptidoglycan-associated protein